MELTAQHIRSSHRGLAEWPGGPEGDELAGAVCRRLALLPDVRWELVEEVRARLLVTGPPSPQDLAEVLLGHLRFAGRRLTVVAL
ncbi:MAG: hypothetical protein WD232_10410 [Acidimicrobiales bacterium]